MVQTLAQLAAHALKVDIVHQDDYFLRDEDVPSDPIRKIKNWDCREALDMDKFKHDLSNIKSSNMSVTRHVEHLNVDATTEKFGDLTSKIRALQAAYSEICKGRRVILVEGFMMYNDPEIAGLLDLKLLIRAPYRLLKERRARRPGYQTLDSFWVDPPFYFDEFVYKSYAHSHAFLFANTDVEGTILPESGVQDFINDDDTPIMNAVKWVCDQIADLCSE